MGDFLVSFVSMRASGTAIVTSNCHWSPFHEGSSGANGTIRHFSDIHPANMLPNVCVCLVLFLGVRILPCFFARTSSAARSSGSSSSGSLAGNSNLMHKSSFFCCYTSNVGANAQNGHLFGKCTLGA
eukprot:1285701-Amphidinium_carterae.1